MIDDGGGNVEGMCVGNDVASTLGDVEAEIEIKKKWNVKNESKNDHFCKIEGYARFFKNDHFWEHSGLILKFIFEK